MQTAKVVKTVRSDLEKQSKDQLLLGMRTLVASERKITRDVLLHINEVQRRRLYADLGFPTLFEWLTKDIGYSAPAAYRRLQAARILKRIPTISEKIDSGELNLSTLAKVQSTIRAEEKRTGKKVDSATSHHALKSVESCSLKESAIRLASLFPEACAEQTRKEVVSVVDEDHVRAHVTLTSEQMQKLERVREILSHRRFKGHASLADVIEAAADELLARRDQLKRVVTARSQKKPITVAETKRTAATNDKTAHKTSKSEMAKKSDSVSRRISSAIRNAIFRRDQGRCQYQDVKSGRRCHSSYGAEIDHIVPRALGGTNDPDNLRVACRTHNLLYAERTFGRNKIDKFRRKDD